MPSLTTDKSGCDKNFKKQQCRMKKVFTTQKIRQTPAKGLNLKTDIILQRLQLKTSSIVYRISWNYNKSINMSNKSMAIVKCSRITWREIVYERWASMNFFRIKLICFISLKTRKKWGCTLTHPYWLCKNKLNVWTRSKKRLKKIHLFCTILGQKLCKIK
jgi:hypothetical protein